MMLRRVLCCFALLLNVASLCVSGSGAAGTAAIGPGTPCISDSSDADCSSPGPAAVVHPPAPGVVLRPSGSCPNGTQPCTAPAAAAAAGSCPDTGSTGADTGDTCTSPAQGPSGGSNGGGDRSTAREHELTGKEGHPSS
ncbi:uncharacterized protein TM35_000501210, partial [Trypanosoma theileri]